MAQNTVQDTIAQIKYLTGQTNLSNADAVRLINYALDKYTHLALSADGKGQADDSTNADISRAVATLPAGEYKIQVGEDFLTWQYLEIVDGDERRRLVPFDQRFDERVTPLASNVGKPSRYDFFNNVFFFDVYADKDYVIRAHYGRAFNHVSLDDLTATIGVPSHHAEYIALHAATRVGVSTSDSAYNQIVNERMVMEREIGDFYRSRDEDMPQVLQAKMDVRR